LTKASNKIDALKELLLIPTPNDGQFTVVFKGKPKNDLHNNLIITGQSIHK